MDRGWLEICSRIGPTIRRSEATKVGKKWRRKQMGDAETEDEQ